MARGRQRQDLTNAKIVVPRLWETDWQSLVAAADGVERDALVTQQRLAALLKPFSPEPTTPEKVAWLSLWSRAFGHVRGALGAWQQDSLITLKILSRLVTELQLHLRAIVAPISEPSDPDSARLQVRDRLSAYTAWCLSGDVAICRFQLKPDTLAGFFDPQPTREQVAALGDELEAWTRLTGQEYEIRSDQEADLDRKRAEAVIRDRLERYQAWQDHPRLSQWRHRIRQLKEAKPGPLLFSELFGLGDSMKTILRGAEAEFAYAHYLDTSAAVHGSSLGSSLVLTDALISPEVGALADELDAELKQIIVGTNLNSLPLSITLAHALQS